MMPAFHPAPALIRAAVSSFVTLLALASPPRCHAQSNPKVEYGLVIPNDHTPWAVDFFQNQPQLVPIHHSMVMVNRHTGKNAAGSLAASFLYRPKITTELKGTNARTQLHTRTPVFYLLMDGDEDPDGEGRSSDAYTFVIARAVPVKEEKRVVDNLSYNAFGTNAKRREQFIETKTSTTDEGWKRIEPKEPMNEGEYCILPIPTTKGTYSTEVFDFGIHLDAANEKDAILAKDLPPASHP